MSEAPPPVIAYATPSVFVDAFHPSGKRAKRAITFIALAVGISLFTTIASQAIIYLVDFRQAQGGLTPPLVAALIVMSVLGLIHTALWILAVVFYCRWQYQAHRNLYALRQLPRYTPGWGVGYWFIPILNLFRPYRVLKDLATLSDSRQLGFAQLSLYWGCWITSAILSNVTLQLPDSPEVRIITTTIDVLAMVLQIVAALLVFKLIRFIVEAQAQSSTSAATAVAPE